MPRLCVRIALLVMLVPVPGSYASTSGANGTWVVNPAEPGPDLPPAGRSLFDFLVTEQRGGKITYQVPFPFAALRERLAQQLQQIPQRKPPIKQVLIPLGRSLQRTAAAPAFFRYPRLVLAVDGEPVSVSGFSGMFLKDRLYIGYLEKAGILEVISYNETAGRFEFQIVKDYRAGGKPTLSYANRAVCVTCHQNATPIFSRPLWGETNANHQIAALLKREDRDFYGVPVQVGIDTPNAIDDATDRANWIPAIQLLWQQGCGVPVDSPPTRACRAQALQFALQYRLSATLQFAFDTNSDWRAFAETLETGFRQRWPSGLLISDPDIPNRIPVSELDVSGASATNRERLLQQMHVPSHLEPLRPRAALQRLEAEQSAKPFVIGIAGFLAAVDVQRLDQHLFRTASQQKDNRVPYRGICQVTQKPAQNMDAIRLSLRCGEDASASTTGFTLTGRLYMDDDGVLVRGAVDRLRLDKDSVLTDLRVSQATLERSAQKVRLSFQLSRAQLHARTADGNAIEFVEISWKAAPANTRSTAFSRTGNILVSVVRDFTAISKALIALSANPSNQGEDALSSLPLRRTAVLNNLYAALDMPALQLCCTDSSRLPPATGDEHTDDPASTEQLTRGPTGPEQGFYRNCARCHRTGERFPPNFLQGNLTTVRNKLAHCAERLYVRLQMWAVPEADRIKTPMPPVHALAQFGQDPDRWPHSTELADLQRYVRELLKSQTGEEPKLEAFQARGYENLRSCLAEAG